ncbi:ArgS-related anticodon-binding protein NrtL [Streptomyces sp. NPDC060194]|uniref:ArgS-related anticodon-binding protein NrtL n=1 Tax=Streptomyces sp. NPDC060194 TaxID=3347069 RepID=UPI00366A1BC2
MTPAELSRTVCGAVRRAVDAGELSAPVPETAPVERPRPGGHGDYATGVALRLAKAAGRDPRQVADILRPHLGAHPAVARVDVTGPGFLNITLAERPDVAAQIRRLGPAYGHGDALQGVTAELRVPREARAQLLAAVVARLAATQGGQVHVRDAASPAEATLRPVPAGPDATETLLGADAYHWALLATPAGDRPRTAGLLAQTDANELFRVRYAHARTRALLRNAAALGLAPAEQPGADTGPDTDPDAAPLATALADHPTALAAAARLHAPDRLARHLVVIADAVLDLQHTALPLGDRKPSAGHRTRLALAEAAGTVLAAGLSLLGVSAPEHL